jgi:hypothetical protein
MNSCHRALNISLLTILVSLISMPSTAAAGDLYAGFRGSKIWNYSPSYWSRVGDTMSTLITSPSTKKAAVWIVSFYGGDGDIYATFPSDGTPLTHVSFTSTDYNETYLNEFDKQGIRVWLQVEPGAADMASLIDRVLSRYHKHPCVAGFGVDVEWLDPQIDPSGRAVTNAEAEAWETRVRSYDTTYTLFLKHFTKSRMPGTYRGSIMFVDDSQQFSSSTACVNEFKAWGQAFAPSPVGFQFGYPDDRPWWSRLSNPPAALGNALKDAIPNTKALFWVDFTITEVFPTAVMSVADRGVQPRAPETIALGQNYPNPFNPSTVITFTLRQAGRARIELFNAVGESRGCVLDRTMEAGGHRVTIDGSGLAAGVYYYRLTANGASVTKKMTLLK